MLNGTLLTSVLTRSAMSYGSNRLRREQDESGELSNDPFETVARLRTRYEESGVEPPEAKKKTTLLEGLLNVLDMPGNAVRGALEEGFRYGGKNALEGAVAGLTHEKQYSTQDWLKRAGVQNKVVAGVGGFIGDILLDPTTYIGGGAVRTVGASAMKGAGKAMGQKALTGMAAKLATTLGAKVDDVMRKLAQKGVGEADDLMSAAAKITGKGASAGDIFTHKAAAIETDAMSKTMRKDALEKMRGAAASMAGGRVKDKQAIALADMLSTSPTTGASHIDDILGRTGAGKPKNSAEWKKVYDAFDTRYNTHIGKHPTDPAAAAQARAILRGMTPEQLETAFRVVDEIGAPIIGADEVKGFNRIKTIIDNMADPNKVANAVEARRVYSTAVTTANDAKYELQLANGLQVAVNELGERRVIGIQLPFTNSVLPLADVTRLAQKADPARTWVYNNIPGVAKISDWWDKAIRGEPTWRLVQQGLGMEAKGMMEVTKRFGRVKGALPLHMEGFIKNFFGADFLNEKYTKVQRAVPFLIEGAAEIEDMEPVHKYMMSKIAPQMFFGPTAGQMGAEFSPDALKRMDAWAESIGALTDDELAVAQDMVHRIKMGNDTIFQLEKAMGLEDMYDKLGGEYNPQYVYHLYESMSGKNAKNAVRLNPERSAQAATSGTRAIFHDRSYKTLAHAIAAGAELVPIDNIITIQAMRMSETIRHGIYKSILDGIDSIHGLDDIEKATMKGLDVENVAPLERATQRTVHETVEYPMTPVEKGIRDTALNSRVGAAKTRLSDIEKSVKHVRYDTGEFAKKIERAKDLIGSTTRALAKETIPEKQAALKAKLEGLNRYLDNLQSTVDGINTGTIKPKRGRPNARQRDIMEQEFLKKSGSARKAVFHSDMGDIEVEVTGSIPGPTKDNPQYIVKGFKTPVDSAKISLTPEASTTGPKPWDEYYVDMEYTPQQTAERTRLEGNISSMEAELANPNPTKKRTMERTVTDIRDTAGREREDAIAAREAIQASVEAYRNAVGSGEGLKAFKDLFRRADDTTMAMKASDYVPVDELFGTKGKYYVHKDLKPALEQFTTRIVYGEGLNDLMDMYDTATRYIKTLQTTLNPSFVPRNLVGEATMSMLHGTSVDAFTTGQEVLKKLGGFTTVGTKRMYNTEAVLKLRMLRPGDMVNVNGTVKSAQQAVEDLIAENSVQIGGKAVYIEDLFADFVRTGLGQAGMLTETLRSSIPEVVEKLEHRGALRTMGSEFVRDLTGKKLSENFAVALPRLYKNLMRAGSEWTEQSFRLADFIHDLGKGLSVAEAAMEVKKFHVDYADLTSFEKGLMRRLVPYYTFMRKNIPMQLRLLVEKPGYYSAVGHMIRNGSAAVGNPTTPDYLVQNLALPIFEDDDGTVTYFNWNLPLTDMARFSNDWEENWKQGVGSLSPFIRVPFEMATGRTTMYDSEIDDPLKYAASNLGGVNVLYKALTGGFGPQGEGQYAQPGQIAGYSSLFPRKNPSNEELKKMYEYRDQLLADMQARKKRGEPIPYIEDTAAGSYDRSRSYQKNKQDYTAPHKRK